MHVFDQIFLISKFEEIKQEALKKRIEHTNQEYEKQKEHNKKYSNFVRKKDTQQSKENLKQISKPTFKNPLQLYEEDSLDQKVFLNQIAQKQQQMMLQPSKTKNAVNFMQNSINHNKNMFNQQSIQEHIDVDDKIPDNKGDISSDEQYKQYFMNKSQMHNHIPQKLERVQPGQAGKLLSNYDQLAFGVQKPPSAKSAARRFNERGGGGGNDRAANNVKLTKDSLKKFDSQIELKLFPEDNSQEKKEVYPSQQPLPWAKNQKLHSPMKNSQNQKNQRKNQLLQKKNLLEEQQQIHVQLPEQATFGNTPSQLDQFTFGKSNLGGVANDAPSRIPRISNQPKNQPQQVNNKKVPLNRAPSVPNNSKSYKLAAVQRNKSQNSMKRKQSEKAISMISERTEKQSIGGISQDTKLQNLRVKYGNPNIKKIRPMVPKPDDPYQVMLAKQQQYLLAKKQTALSQDNQKLETKHKFQKSKSKSKLINKQANSKNYKKPFPQSTASQAAV